MPTRINILIILFLAAFLTSCNDFGDRQNPLYGIIYRHESEVSQLKNYMDIGGSVIDNIKDKSSNFEFGIAHLTHNNRNILIFEQFIKEPNNPKSKYRILDTININYIKDNEHITYCNCQQDTLPDPEIIALVIADEDKEYYNKIVQAWRADIETGKITLIKNKTGINCINEDYGLDGCGENDLPEQIFNNEKPFEIINSFHATTDESSLKDTSMCKGWSIPQNILPKIFKDCEPIDRHAWHYDFNVLPCIITGQLKQNEKTYKYEINAGSWIYVFCPDTVILLGSYSKTNEKYFLNNALKDK